MVMVQVWAGFSAGALAEHVIAKGPQCPSRSLPVVALQLVAGWRYPTNLTYNGIPAPSIGLEERCKIGEAAVGQ